MHLLRHPHVCAGLFTLVFTPLFTPCRWGAATRIVSPSTRHAATARQAATGLERLSVHPIRPSRDHPEHLLAPPPGRHFPCKYLVPPPPTYASTGAAPFCKRRPAVKVLEMKVPADYPDISPNPRSRHFHKTVDHFRDAGKKY